MKSLLKAVTKNKKKQKPNVRGNPLFHRRVTMRGRPRLRGDAGSPEAGAGRGRPGGPQGRLLWAPHLRDRQDGSPSRSPKL